MNVTRRRSVLGDISATNRTYRSVDSESNLVLLPEEMWTRSPSPEEQIIQQRGTLRALRQSPLGLTFFDSENDSLPGTPIKGLPVNTRKRLLMTPPNTSSTPKKDVKKPRVARKPNQVALKIELGAYSAVQLVNLIDKMVLKHPELEHEVRESMSSPDLKVLEENLNQLTRTIYKAFPQHRWGSTRDAYCYKRVRLHIEEFKRTCLKQGRTLVKAQSWEAVIKYVLMATKFADQLPVWEEPSHNDAKKKVQRCLAAQCLVALKKGTFEKEALREIRDKLKPLVCNNADFATCVLHTENVLDKLP